jgi:hypothetical protein
MDAEVSELLTQLVRITARTSAGIFVAALAAGGADLLAPPSVVLLAGGCLGVASSFQEIEVAFRSDEC